MQTHKDVGTILTEGSTSIIETCRSQSYQTFISSIFQFLLLSLAIFKYWQYRLMLKILKLNTEKQKKSSFYEEKSLLDWRILEFVFCWRLTVTIFICKTMHLVSLQLPGQKRDPPPKCQKYRRAKKMHQSNVGQKTHTKSWYVFFNLFQYPVWENICAKNVNGLERGCTLIFVWKRPVVYSD